VTLDTFLVAGTRVNPNVDIKKILVDLMARLSEFVQRPENKAKDVVQGVDIFTSFRVHVSNIVDVLIEAKGKEVELGTLLELQLALLQFTLKLHPGQVHYVDLVLGGVVKTL